MPKLITRVPTIIIESRPLLLMKNEIWLVRTFVNVVTVTEDVEIGSYVSW
jgi:hypothetical protein